MTSPRARIGRYSRPRRPQVEALEGRALLSVVPVGPESRVNTTTADNQYVSDVAADADGDYVVTWQSYRQDGNRHGIYAQRYDATGAARGGEFRVNTTTAGDQRSPSVAIDAAGDFVITWQSAGSDGRYRVYAQRYAAAGTPLGGEFRVDAKALGQHSPSVAMDAAGDFVVAWEAGEPGGGIGIFAQKYDQTGVARGGAFQVNTYTTNDQIDPSVAMDAAGDFVVTWTSRYQDGSGYGIYAQRYDAAGAARGGEFRVNSYTPSDQRSPEVAMDAAGDFVVTWYDRYLDGNAYGVFAQRYNPAGVPQGGQFLVNSYTLGRQDFPAVSMDATGDFIIAWQGNTQDDARGGWGFGIFSQCYDAAGNPRGSEFEANSTTAYNQTLPAVAMDGAGDFVITWSSYNQDGDKYGVYAQPYDESTDAAGPVVASLEAGGTWVQTGTPVRSTIPQAVVAFSEDLSTAGGPSGAGSVTNPANWSLNLNSQDASARLTSVTFGLNPTTNKYEAALTFSPQLAEGDYVLTARQAIRDSAGNALDGDFDGSPGGDYALPFSVRRTVRVGPEVTVSQLTNSYSLYPSAAADAAGDYVLAWGRGNIYAARYNAAGEMQGGMFQVSTTATVDTIPTDVAMDAAGNFVVVWVRGGPGLVMARRYDATGRPLGSEFAVSTRVGDWPTVAVGPGGEAVVAWMVHTATSDDVYAHQYDAAGQPLGAEFLVTPGAGYQGLPSVAVDAGGNFVVAWTDLSSVSSTSGFVAARRFDAAGQPVGNEFRLGTAAAPADESFPVVAMDRAGDFVVAWRLSDGSAHTSTVRARLYDAAGRPRGDEFRPTTFGTVSQQEPTVGMDAGGGFVIAWSGAGAQDDRGVYARRYDATGVAQGDEFPVNTFTAGEQRYAAVAVDAGGDFAVGWMSTGHPGATSIYGIYAQRYAANESPTALGVPSVSAVENATPAAVSLWPAFTDSTDASSALSYSVVGDTNPALFSSVSLDPATGNLTLAYAPNAAGAASLTIRATDTGGLSVDSTLAVAVRPAWLTVPNGGVWSIKGTSTNYTLALTSGNFAIPTDPAALNPNLSISVAAPATLAVNADVHLAGLTLNGLGAAVAFNGPTTGGLSFTGGSVPLAVSVPTSEPEAPASPPPPPGLSVGDVAKAEGNAGTTAFSFQVTLDRASDQPVRVYYSTANVTAARGTDYLAAGGVLTFKPGETSKTIVVQVKGDKAVEADERFKVVLYGATGAVVADGTGVGTIKNDDAPPAPRVSVSDARVVEGDKGTKAVTFDVALDHAAAGVVSLKYTTADGTAKAGADYLAASGALVFKPGETRKRVTVLIKGDKAREADEAFFLDLHAPAGGTVRARGVIGNDD